MTTPATDHACAACHGPLEFFGARGGYTYERCRACRSIQLYPLPTPDELSQAYANDYASANHYGTDPDEIYENGKPFFRAVTQALRTAGVSSGRILDVGCGWGGMVRVLRDEGYQPLGIDYASDSLAYCQRQELPVEVMDLNRLVRDGKRFDGILLVTVFEHLVDHRDRLRQLATLLEADGALVVLIPTASLFGMVAGAVRRLRKAREIPAINGTFEPPWHTTILSVEGFERMLDDTPFVVDRVVASPSGHGRGVKRIIQAAATAVSLGGDRLFGRRWPIVLNHIFVCRLTT